MLTDAEIDRYARQIVLPEVGSRGQERLLAARVALRASEDDAARGAAVLCALHLGAAGVGTLAVSDDVAAALTPALAARNPGAKVVQLAGAADATIAIGDAAPATVIAGVGRGGVVVATSRGRCAACIADACAPLVPASAWPRLAASLLAPLAAAVALREILGIGEGARLVVLGVTPAGTSARAIPARPGCRCGMDASSRIG